MKTTNSKIPWVDPITNDSILLVLLSLFEFAKFSIS